MSMTKLSLINSGRYPKLAKEYEEYKKGDDWSNIAAKLVLFVGAAFLIYGLIFSFAQALGNKKLADHLMDAVQIKILAILTGVGSFFVLCNALDDLAEARKGLRDFATTKLDGAQQAALSQKEQLRGEQSWLQKLFC